MAAEALEYRRRHEPGRARAFFLALAVHALLVAVIFVGVRWQSHKPETVTVELWDSAPPPPPPPARVEPPKPVPEPPKPPPEPPKPEPKIEKPQIVEKAPPPKPKPKPEPKPKPKPEPKPKPRAEAKPKPDPQFLKQMQEEAAREQAALEQQARAREAREAQARTAAAASQKALDEWVGRIRGKIRGNIVLPPNMTGNPEAIFDVTLLPDGRVLNVRKRKSSGHPGYDEAVDRAIWKSSALPLPEQRSVFRRELELHFRPQDQ